MCFVVRHSGSGGTWGRVRYEDGDSSGRVRTGDAGKTWKYSTSCSLQYYAFGKVSTPGPAQTATRRYVTGVRVSLQVGDDPAARVETCVTTANAPEALSAVWEADFDTDPTALDCNGDGAGDWVVRGGESFDTGSLSGGVWQADATLDTYPDNDFTALTTIEVRFRNTSVGGNGAVFWINADYSDGTFAPIFACLRLGNDDTQTLTVYHEFDQDTWLPLVQVSGLSDGFVTLRLLIDPQQDTVNVRVDGQDRGTFVYNTLAADNDDRFASILGWGSDAEFDYVRIRVGEANP